MMTLPSRLSVCLLALSLCLISAATASPSLSPSLPQSSPQTSSPAAAAVADEERVRQLTERYAQAIAAGDLAAMRGFWKPQAPELAARLGTYQRVFTNACIEFINHRIGPVTVAGARAHTRLVSDERQLDKVTGAVWTDREVFHGAVRAFEWEKSGDGWQLAREVLLQDELAARLDNASTEQERQQLLEEQRELVTDVLVRALLDRGTQHRMGGDFDASARTLLLAEAIAEKLGDHPGLAKVWLYLARAKEYQGEFDQVLALELRALALHQADGNRLGEATALSAISHTYHERGDYRKAFQSALRCLQLSEAANNRLTKAHALSEMAHVYILQNSPQQAIEYLEKAMAIYQELGDRAQLAIKRFSIVTQQQAAGNYEQAIATYREMIKQIEGGRDAIGAAIVRQAIGKIYFIQGKHAQALEEYNLALAATPVETYARIRVTSLARISEVYRAQSKFADALSFAEEAERLSRQMANQESLREALTAVGYSHLGLQQPVEARRAFTEAIVTTEELRAQTSGGVEEQQRHFEILLAAYHGMMRLLIEEQQPVEALRFAERAKARGLLDILQQGRVNIQKAMTAQEQQQEQRLQSELTRLNTQVSLARLLRQPDKTREYESQQEKARLQYEGFQTTLYAAHPELKVQRGETSLITAEELATLTPDAATALLEYVVTADRAYLFVLSRATATSAPQVQVLRLPGTPTELANRIEAFRQQLARRDLSFRPAAAKLYDWLLKPAAALLRGKTHLVIVPDDTLWDLPFQALAPAGGRFLLEEAAIAYAPSLTVLREMSRKRRPSETAARRLLAFGNPLSEQTAVAGALPTRSAETLAALPEAAAEVRALGGLYGRALSTIYVGADAREDRVKSEAGQAEVLHFAAHGVLNNVSPMYSHLVLAAGSDQDSDKDGDKDGDREDGLLEAWELMRLDLRAELAVLSACETARGRIGAGEGMIGLSWAMFVAGVPSLVVSQWKVEAASTRDLMVSFHRALLATPRTGEVKPVKAQALRQAAMQVMKKAETRHPFYWAGFVLVGDGR